jgi:hypothetical protein
LMISFLASLIWEIPPLSTTIISNSNRGTKLEGTIIKIVYPF